MEEEEEVRLRPSITPRCVASSLSLTDTVSLLLMNHIVQVRAWTSACQHQAVLQCHSEASAREGWELQVPCPSP